MEVAHFNRLVKTNELPPVGVCMLAESTPNWRGSRGHPQKVVQGTSHRQRKAFSVRFMKFWNELPVSVDKIFKKRLEKVRPEIFHHLPH